MSARAAATASLWSDRLTRGAAVAAAFFLPISTAAAGAALALFALAWIASPNLPARLRAAAADPVARAALALALLFAAGTLWSSATAAEAWAEALKYRKLLLLAMMIAVMNERRWRWAVLAAFVAGAFVVIVASMLIAAGVLPPAPRGGPGNAVAFKNHITESFVSALAFFVLLTAARWDARPLARALASIGAAACAAHVLWLLIGRTGYVMLAVMLLTWAALAAGRRRSLVAGALGAAALALFVLASPSFLQRAQSTLAEAREYQQSGAVTSVGMRYLFAQRALELWWRAPLWGHGTGSVATEYAKFPKDTAAASLPTDNLHGEYFGLAVQFGVLGLAAFGVLLWRHGAAAAQLTGPRRDLALGLLVAFAFGALFNSLLRDFTEGHLYAVLAGTLLAGRSKPSP
ncbi:MAG TPA: O-antigen ligase family protein [Burkholderiaceae bacterium]|nr:O-antigen ligase family protein [Burkholderiaceae bacterium]